MNTYFNGLFYVLCVVALVACSSTEATDGNENASTENTEENQGTDNTDTPDDTDTTDNTDTPDDTDTTDNTDTPDDTDTTDNTDTPDDTDTTDNTDTPDDTDTTDNTDTPDDTGTTDDTSTGSEGFTCPEDDNLEDNDTNATATVTTPGSSWNAIACSIDGEFDHDNDVFVVSVDAGCTLYAEVLFAHADGDLDMALTEEISGDLVGTGGQSEDDNEEMVYTPTDSTDVYISIFPFMSMGNEYVLNVNMACP